MKRSRIVLALAALAVASVVLGALHPWSGGRRSTTGGTVAKTVARSGAEQYSAAGSGTLDAAAPQQASGAAGSSLATPAKPADLQNRDMVETATIGLRVGDVDAAANMLDAKVRAVGGRVDGDDRNSDPQGRSANLVLRVPAARLPTLIADAAALGEELNRTLTGEDMTAAHADVKARIDALQASVDRLTEFVRQSAGIDALVRAENELTQRQTELDSARAQKRALEDQISLATLTVTLTAKPVLAALPVEHKGPLGFGSALAKGWHSVVLAWRYSAAGVGYAVPYVALLVTLGFVLWGWHRRARRPVVVLPSDIA